MQALDAAGFEIMQCDESLFSADSYLHHKYWAPKGQPLLKTSHFTDHPKIVVCGVSSPVRGNVHFHYGVRSFNAQDIQEVLRAVR